MKFRFTKVFVVLLAILCAGTVCQFMEDRAYAKDSDGDYVIVIDPGHGGDDVGAVSSITGDKERELNWNIAVALKAELQTYSGVKVYLTRGSAEFSSNVGRAGVGREMGADYLISVHNNSSSSSSPKGVICYGTVIPQYSEASRRMGRAISAEINKLGISLNNGGYATRHSSFGTSSDYYTFIGEASRLGIPSLIIEHCYISNSSDAKFVHELENQYKMGAADATAIANTLGLTKRGVKPGSSITLTRTYSAYIMDSEGASFKSSDESVVKVRSDGLITAAGAGTAVITVSKGGGNKTVSVTVPEVKMVGLSAGPMQKCYLSKEEAYNYDKNLTVVKAIYSDGSAVQINSGWTEGDLYLGTPYDEGGGHVMTPVCRPISYNGFNATLKFYYFTSKEQVTTSYATRKLVGSNKDIFLMPGIYSTGGGNSGVIEEKPTTKPTSAPETTEEVRTEESTEIIVSTAESSAENNSEDNSGSDISDKNNKKSSKNNTWLIVICIVLVIVIAAAACVLIYINNNKKRIRRRGRRRRRRRR